MRRGIVLSVLACFCLTGAAFGQTVAVTGVVRSPGAMPAPGATVAMEGPAAKKTVFADEGGRFQAALPPGKYQVKVSLLGFQPQDRDFELPAGQEEAELEFTLALSPLPAAVARLVEAARSGGFAVVSAQASALRDREKDSRILACLAYGPDCAPPFLSCAIRAAAGGSPLVPTGLSSFVFATTLPAP